MTMVAKCIHHFVIGAPKDGVAHGICKYCKEERDFLASPDGQKSVPLQVTKPGVLPPNWPKEWWEDHRQQIIDDYEKLGFRGCREKWGILHDGPLRSYLREWGVFKPGKRRTPRPERQDTEGLSLEAVVEKFPPFDSSWIPEVQVQWFLTFRHILSLVKEGALWTWEKRRQ